MFAKILPASLMCLVALVTATALIMASDQGSQPKPPEGNSAAQQTSQLVKTGLYMISGGGANSLMRFSANGLILVDGKLPGQYRAFMSQVRRISRLSDLPVRFLILTDHHDDRAGNSEQFVAAGVRLIAHENVARRLAAVRPADAKPATIALTFEREHTVHLGGIEVRLMHFGNAHTDGDTVVYFPNLKVVAVGDLFAATPDPDFEADGSFVGWGAVLAEILKLDFDVVVPSTGPTVTRADLAAFKTRIDTMVSRATGLMKKGVSKDQLMARLKTADLGWSFNFTGDRLDRFYTDLSRTK